jgi:hypothetical protein
VGIDLPVEPWMRNCATVIRVSEIRGHIFARRFPRGVQKPSERRRLLSFATRCFFDVLRSALPPMSCKLRVTLKTSPLVQNSEYCAWRCSRCPRIPGFPVVRGAHNWMNLVTRLRVAVSFQPSVVSRQSSAFSQTRKRTYCAKLPPPIFAQ